MAVRAKLTGREAAARTRYVPVGDLLAAALLVTLAAIGILGLLLPMIVIVLVSFDSGPVLRFPPQELSLERYAAVPSLRGFADAIRLSLAVGAITVAIDILLGVPAAISLARSSVRGKSLIIAFLQSPIMVPGIVVGIAILFFVSFAGVGLSTPLLILSHVVITLPFLLRITYARMETADRTLEEAAEDLGASGWQVSRHIVLPHLAPGIVGGSALAFLLSFDNLPVSVFTAPVLDPPLPVYLFKLLLYDINPIVAPIATLQIVITFIVLGVALRTVGLGTVVPGAGGRDDRR